LETKTKTEIGHITPVKVYLAVGFALFILTALTVKISTIPLGAWNAIVAIAIATLKALLVILFFMHLLYDKKIYLVVVGTAIIILSILIALTMADILSRGDIYEFESGPINPQAKIYTKSTAVDTGKVAQGFPNSVQSETHTGPEPIGTSMANHKDNTTLYNKKSAGDTASLEKKPVSH
jgi:cytochrome c oxidase subunit IV